MKKYDITYKIKDDKDINNKYETAKNLGIEGSLVLIDIEGHNITLRNMEFGNNIGIYINSNSDGIFFDGCVFHNNFEGIQCCGNRVLFNECRFENGKKYVENSGYAVFNRCDFYCSQGENILISSMNNEWSSDKLIYTVIMESNIHFFHNNSMAFITDGDDNMALINNNIIGNDNNIVILTKQMANKNTFAYYNIGYVCGIEECGYEITREALSAFNIWNLLSGEDGWNPLNIQFNGNGPKREVFFISTDKNLTFRAQGENKIIKLRYYPENAELGYGCKSSSFVDVTELYQEKNTIILEVNGRNDSEDTIFGYVMFVSDNDLKTEGMVEIKPSIIEPPKFLSTPVIVFKDGRASVSYELALDGREDKSEISWYRIDNIDRTNLVAIKEFTRSNERDCRKIAVSRINPCREIALTPFDIGKHMKVNIKPRHSRSNQGAGLNVISRIVMASDVKANNIVVNLENQVLNPYYKNEPGYGTATGIWFYKKLHNCRNYGLVTESGDCGYYLEGTQSKDAMTVYVILDLENNNGEGFGRRGEYQEIYIKYNSIKKSGYGIRYECIDKNMHMAGFTLYKYEGVEANQISTTITGPYMKSGMDIKLDIENGLLNAEITVPDLEEPLILEAYIDGNNHSGMGIKSNMVSVEGNRIGIRHIEMSYKE